MATAVEKAYQEIRAGILSGHYPSGSRLKEEDLAAQIGVSRTPVREALRRLHASQIVTFGSNHRAYVAAWSHQDVDELFTLRAMVESYAMELAANRIDEQQIEILESLQAELEKEVNAAKRKSVDRIATLNSKFHKTLYEAARSERVALMLSRLIEIPIVLGTYRTYSRAELQRSLRHHEELIEALKAHDGQWAASVMKSHVLAARAVYLTALKKQELDGEGRAAEAEPRARKTRKSRGTGNKSTD